MSEKVPEYQVIRILRWYQKKGDSLIGEIPLLDINVDDIRKLFSECDQNPLYDSYCVKDQHIDFLQHFIEEKIDLDVFDYFVECDAI